MTTTTAAPAQPPNDLIDALLAVQRANRWTDVRMARELGLNRQMWRFLRTGERRAGVATLRAIRTRFPALADAVSAFVGGD